MIDVRFAAFDLTNGTVISDATSSGLETSISDEGNDWYRISMKFTTSANVDTSGSYLGAVRINVAGSDGNHGAYAGDTTKGIIQWGSQLNTDSLKTFQATTGTARDGKASIVTYYNAVGGEDATQVTQSYQPLLYNAGLLVRDGASPAIEFEGSQKLMIPTLVGKARFDSFVVFNSNPKATHANVLLSSGDGKYGLTFQNGESSTSIQSDFGTPQEFIDGSLMAANATRNDFYLAFVSTKRLFSLIDGSTSAFSNFQMGWHNAHNSVHNFAGKISEMTFFDSNQSANREAIEADIADFHNITLS